MNIYFELADSVKISEGKYFAMYGVTGNERGADWSRYFNLMLRSNRAWAEDDDGFVSFAKNRFVHSRDSAYVDMKEFLWIKLKCQTVCT